MIGDRIRRARKISGFSQRELADKAALSVKTLRQYEHNKVIPSFIVLVRLAKALQVKVEYFSRPQYLRIMTTDNNSIHYLTIFGELKEIK